uniref:Uncharacterized protein n=1 Tax=Romanomermis culicivorax TaxID=13658 RepID=A0A915IZB8_ROMCU
MKYSAFILSIAMINYIVIELLYSIQAAEDLNDDVKRLAEDPSKLRSKFISRFGRGRARLTWGKRFYADADNEIYGFDKRIPIQAFYGKPLFYRRYGK